MPALPGDDYYALLGVPRGADAVELRRAWRRLAVRYHPDRAGVAATEMFQRLAAAYEVLSDPLARAAYDRRRRQTEPPRGGQSPPPRTSTGTPSQPVRPPAPCVMLSRICGPFNALIACGVLRFDDDADDGCITLMLREEEAAQGGMATISMRVQVWCPECAATTDARRAPARRGACTRCGGTGTVEELFSAWLAVPPGVTAGEVLTPSVGLPGMVSPVRFRIRMIERGGGG